MRRFHIVKRNDSSILRMILFYVIAVVIALVIGAILLSTLKVNFWDFYKRLFTIGIIGNAFPYKCVQNLINVYVPLLITSLALSLAYRMKFWNVGGEGQFIVGAVVAAWVSIAFGSNLPVWLNLILMMVTGGLAAGVFGMITALLKVKWGTSETMMTLMLNYIALYVLQYFANNKTSWNLFLDADSARPKFTKIPESAFMPTIAIGKFNLNISLIFGILLVIFMVIYLGKSKSGYEISVVGDSVPTAKYAGMKVNKIIIRTVFLSASLVGVAGALYLSSSHTLSTSITNDVGWTGVIVAWLSRLNPIGILVTSFLISVLQYGTVAANANFTAVDANFANLLQGIILFAVLAADFLLKFKIVRTNTQTEEKEVQ